MIRCVAVLLLGSLAQGASVVVSADENVLPNNPDPGREVAFSVSWVPEAGEREDACRRWVVEVEGARFVTESPAARVAHAYRHRFATAGPKSIRVVPEVDAEAVSVRNGRTLVGAPRFWTPVVTAGGAVLEPQVEYRVTRRAPVSLGLMDAPPGEGPLRLRLASRGFEFGAGRLTDTIALEQRGYYRFAWAPEDRVRWTADAVWIVQEQTYTLEAVDALEEAPRRHAQQSAAEIGTLTNYRPLRAAVTSVVLHEPAIEEPAPAVPLRAEGEDDAPRFARAQNARQDVLLDPMPRRRLDETIRPCVPYTHRLYSDYLYRPAPTPVPTPRPTPVARATPRPDLTTGLSAKK